MSYTNLKIDNADHTRNYWDASQILLTSAKIMTPIPLITEVPILKHSSFRSRYVCYFSFLIAQFLADSIDFTQQKFCCYNHLSILFSRFYATLYNA